MKALLLVISALLHLSVSSMIWAATEFGVVDELEGAAYTVDEMGQQHAIRLGQVIFTGQSVHTATNTELHITSVDGGLIALRPNSSFQVDAYVANHSPQDKVVLRLIKGGLRSVTGWVPRHHPQSYEVKTSVATIGIRGTDHEVHILADGHEEAGVHNRVHSGVTVLRNALGEVHIGAGEFAKAPHDAASPPVMLKQKPGFHDSIPLRIEHRLEKRRDELLLLLEEMRDAWLKRFGRDA
jgi:hypothetical protein